MTDKPTPMETAIERRPSLADAEVVRQLKNGTTRTRLKNKRTGEYFYSVCSAHWDYAAECEQCHMGGWHY